MIMVIAIESGDVTYRIKIISTIHSRSSEGFFFFVVAYILKETL